MVMFPVLNETQRLQYLQTLGVTSWLPTQELPGSHLNSILWQPESPSEPELNAAIVAQPQLPSQNNEPVQRIVETKVDPQLQAAAVADALGALTAIPNNEQPSAKLSVQSHGALSNAPSGATEDKAVARTQANTVAPMHLGLSLYSNGVLVVNDVPLQDGAAMSSPIQRLQTAIVNAMGYGETPQVMPISAAEFNWPLVPGPHGDHSLEGATCGLLYSLSKLLLEQSCHKVLLMGPSPVVLLQPDLALGAIGKLQLAGPQSDKVDLVSTHSLHQLLAVPNLKADTWQHLQPFVTSPKP